MKRNLLLTLGAVIIIAVQFFVNCSNPLDDSGGGFEPSGPVIDTIYNDDTIIVIDTLIYEDTIFNEDTIMIIDTVIYFDTLFVSDTLFVVDTLTYVDTAYSADTIIFIDTVTIVDTVVVVEVDTLLNQVCSRISSNQSEIVWMFRNEAGMHLLEFTAVPESEHPAQTLSVFIEGREYQWIPTENPEFITELELSENTIIRIMPKKPPSLGHAIHICLHISRL
jgi:hypothetical protein